MQTIGLCMIVKDEAKTIERCLHSVLPYIDAWTIVDTGSTDGTQDIIREFFYRNKVPGSIIERIWRDFGTNRSEALSYARARSTDYTLMIDADDVLAAPPGYAWPDNLDRDAYNLTIRHGNIEFPRVQLFKTTSPWYYRGVLHEFPECATPNPKIGTLPVVMQTGREGNRSQDPHKYQKDAQVLEKALRDQASTSGPDFMLQCRYTFYLAQSYRDAGDLQNALKYYVQRAQMGGYREEVYFSLYQCLKISVSIDDEHSKIEFYYNQAEQVETGRAEHAHHYAWYLRTVPENYEGAVEVLKPYFDAKMPPEALFGEPWVYRYGVLDELSVCLYWTGQPAEALLSIMKMLKGKTKLPPSVLSRAADNAKHCVLQLGS